MDQEPQTRTTVVEGVEVPVVSGPPLEGGVYGDEPPQKAIHVAAAVIREGHKILSAERNYGEFNGWWEFPGGKLEPGEGSWEACVRELHEELDVAVGDPEPLCQVDYDYPEFHLTMDCFLCSIVEGTLHLHDHDHLAWVGPDDMDRLHWLPADHDVIELLKVRLRES